MHRQRNVRLFLFGLILLLCPIWCPSAHAQQGTTNNPVRIGMVDTLFNDISPAMQAFGKIAFGALMKQSTGMTGRMTSGGDALSLGKDLAEGKVDLAVFHGIEFAWARKEFPNLRPLMLAITKYKHAQAVIVVRKKDAPEDFAQLRNKTFAFPQQSREHCRLFMARCCEECGQPCAQFFGEIVKPNQEQALDDVCLGTAKAAVVDRVVFEFYKEVKPGCHARLKVLKESELFPTGVIAYREGALPKNVLAKFRSGLLAAANTSMGQELLAMFRITGFENVTTAYERDLTAILKNYPPPVK